MRKNLLVSLASSSLILLVVARFQARSLDFLPFFLSLFLFAFLLSLLILAHFRQLPEKRCRGWLFASAMAIGGIYLMGVNPWVGIIGDNIVYLRDAMELMKGKNPLAVNYGIGITGMLIPALALFREQVVATKATIALTGLLFPLFAFFALRRFTSVDRALTLAVISGILPISVDYAAEVMADLPYAAFSLVALCAILRYLDQPGRSWAWLAGVSVALGWAYHIKSPALILALAAGVYLVLRGHLARALEIAAGMAIWVVPWMILEAKGAGKMGYFSSLADQIGRGEHMPEAEIGDFWHNLLYFLFRKNPQDYLNNLGEVFFCFDFPLEKWILLGLIVAGFTAGRGVKQGNLLSLLRSLQIHDWYTLGYLAMLFTLPGSPARYLIPVLPFLLFYLFRGVDLLTNLSRRPFLARAIPAVLTLGLFLSSFHEDMNLIAMRRGQTGYSGYWGNYYQAALWIRDNTPPGSWVAARKPTLVWFWSRRESDLYPWTLDLERGWQELKRRFDYVLVDYLPFFPETRKYLVPLIQAHADRFEVMYVTPPPENYVLRILKD